MHFAQRSQNRSEICDWLSHTLLSRVINETEEADKVSANIAKLLNERSFAFTVARLTTIHRRIFDGVFKFAGQIRDYNITKKEWVLRGDTSMYLLLTFVEPTIKTYKKESKGSLSIQNDSFAAY